MGYRFEEATGAVLSPETKKPISERKMAEVLEELLLGRRHNALERAHHLLSKKSGAGQLSPADKRELDALLSTEGDALPANFRKALENLDRDFAGARDSAERAYADSTRYFDGQATLSDRLKASLPVQAGGWNEPNRPAVYFNETERRLGETLSADLAEFYARTPAAAPVLEGFRDKTGKIVLPPVLVLKIDPQAGAHYNPENRSIVANHEYVLEGLLESVPRDRREATRAELQDSGKLARYLLDHPKARETLLQKYDVEFFHELTHAWQDKRRGLMVEEVRGNAPGVMALEFEHEAFLMQNKYIHAKLLKDPDKTMEEPWFGGYLELLGDFDRWREAITRQYMDSWPQFAGNLKKAEEIQDTRIGLARRLMGEGLYARVSGWLKLRGYELGSREIRTEASAQMAAMESFHQSAYPVMRREGFSKMGEALDRQGRFLEAFQARSAAGDARALARSADKLAAWLAEQKAKPNKIPLKTLQEAEAALAAYYEKTGGKRGSKCTPATALRRPWPRSWRWEAAWEKNPRTKRPPRAGPRPRFTRNPAGLSPARFRRRGGCWKPRAGLKKSPSSALRTGRNHFRPRSRFTNSAPAPITRRPGITPPPRPPPAAPAKPPKRRIGMGAKPCDLAPSASARFPIPRKRPRRRKTPFSFP